jgi:uncharacterized protein
MNARNLLLLAVLACCAGPLLAFNTGIPGSGLPGALDYSSKVLPEREGVVSWKTLAQVQPVKQGGKMTAEFSKDILALDRKDVKVQGFMIPLDIGEKQKRFLISAVPADCQFCLPAGPDGLIEVVAKTPVSYTFEPIVVSGRFAVVKDDPSGVLYRMTDAGRVDAAPSQRTVK